MAYLHALCVGNIRPWPPPNLLQWHLRPLTIAAPAEQTEAAPAAPPSQEGLTQPIQSTQTQELGRILTNTTDFSVDDDEKAYMARLIAERGMSDYRVIHEGPAHFSTSDSIRLHEVSIAWLEQKLKQEEFTGKTVVITHHLPSFDSVPDRYKHGTYNGINPAYASNLDHMLGSSHLWIHGHTHDSFDYVKNGTRVICNPRGYVLPSHDHDNQEFNPQLIVEI